MRHYGVMRALSEQTRNLIDELYQLVRERTWPLNRAAHVEAVAELLARIASSAEPLAVPRIISLVLDGRREIAEATARAVRQLRKSVGIRDLVLFDRAFRDLSPYMHPESARW